MLFSFYEFSSRDDVGSAGTEFEKWRNSHADKELFSSHDPGTEFEALTRREPNRRATLIRGVSEAMEFNWFVQSLTNRGIGLTFGGDDLRVEPASRLTDED